jgi:hypothetical protein
MPLLLSLAALAAPPTFTVHPHSAVVDRPIRAAPLPEALQLTALSPLDGAWVHLDLERPATRISHVEICLQVDGRAVVGRTQFSERLSSGWHVFSDNPIDRRGCYVKHLGYRPLGPVRISLEVVLPDPAVDALRLQTTTVVLGGS